MSKYSPSVNFLTKLKANKNAAKQLRQIERFQKELQFVEYFHDKVPSPPIADHQWINLLKTKSVAERVGLYEYIAITERRIQRDSERLEEQKQERKRKLDEQKAIFDAGGMGYGPNMYQLMLSPFRMQKHINHLEGIRQAHTRILSETPKIAFDCQYFSDPAIAPKDLSKMATQLKYSLTENDEQRRRPFHFEFINCNWSNPGMKEAARLGLGALSTSYGDQRVLPDVYTTNPYPHGSRDVYYLSKDANQYLQGPLDPSKTIIIPVTMDRTKASLKTAKQMQYRHVYLPVRKYIKWQAGNFYLPIPNILRIFSMVALSGGDWESAIKANVAIRHTKSIEERRQDLGARYDQKRQNLRETQELVRMLEDAVGKEIPDV